MNMMREKFYQKWRQLSSIIHIFYFGKCLIDLWFKCVFQPKILYREIIYAIICLWINASKGGWADFQAFFRINAQNIKFEIGRIKLCLAKSLSNKPFHKYNKRALDIQQHSNFKMMIKKTKYKKSNHSSFT